MKVFVISTATEINFIPTLLKESLQESYLFVKFWLIGHLFLINKCGYYFSSLVESNHREF